MKVDSIQKMDKDGLNGNISESVNLDATDVKEVTEVTTSSTTTSFSPLILKQPMLLHENVVRNLHCQPSSIYVPSVMR